MYIKALKGWGMCLYPLALVDGQQPKLIAIDTCSKGACWYGTQLYFALCMHVLVCTYSSSLDKHRTSAENYQLWYTHEVRRYTAVVSRGVTSKVRVKGQRASFPGHWHCTVPSLNSVGMHTRGH